VEGLTSSSSGTSSNNGSNEASERASESTDMFCEFEASPEPLILLSADCSGPGVKCESTAMASSKDWRGFWSRSSMVYKGFWSMGGSDIFCCEIDCVYIGGPV